MFIIVYNIYKTSQKLALQKIKHATKCELHNDNWSLPYACINQYAQHIHFVYHILKWSSGNIFIVIFFFILHSPLPVIKIWSQKWLQSKIGISFKNIKNWHWTILGGLINYKCSKETHISLKDEKSFLFYPYALSNTTTNRPIMIILLQTLLIWVHLSPRKSLAIFFKFLLFVAFLMKVFIIRVRLLNLFKFVSSSMKDLMCSLC